MRTTYPPLRMLLALAMIAGSVQLVGCGRVEELEAQVSSLESENTELRERVIELEKELEKSKQKLDDVQQALSQVDSDLDDVEHEAIALDSSEKFSLESAVDSLRDSVDTAINEAE
jgi:septal ring factor EnvC (AmiA/AmiB activator)